MARKPRFGYNGSGAIALLSPFLETTAYPHVNLLCPAPSFRVHSESLPSLCTAPAQAGSESAHTCPTFLPLTMFELVICSLNYSELLNTDQPR